MRYWNVCEISTNTAKVKVIPKNIYLSMLGKSHLLSRIAKDNERVPQTVNSACRVDPFVMSDHDGINNSQFIAHKSSVHHVQLTVWPRKRGGEQNPCALSVWQWLQPDFELQPFPGLDAICNSSWVESLALARGDKSEWQIFYTYLLPWWMAADGFPGSEWDCGFHTTEEERGFVHRNCRTFRLGANRCTS